MFSLHGTACCEESVQDVPNLHVRTPSPPPGEKNCDTCGLVCVQSVLWEVLVNRINFNMSYNFDLLKKENDVCQCKEWGEVQQFDGNRDVLLPSDQSAQVRHKFGLNGLATGPALWGHRTPYGKCYQQLVPK